MSRTTDRIIDYQSSNADERRAMRSAYPDFFAPKTATVKPDTEHDRECHHCDGKGWYERGPVGYRWEVDCGRCDGSGRIPPIVGR